MYVKLAGDAGQAWNPPPAEDKTLLTQAYEAGGGKSQAPVYGANFSNSGTGSIAQALTPAATDLFGGAGAFVGPFLQLFGKSMPQELSTALYKQRRFAAGAGTTAESQQISDALTAANSRLMARHSQMMASALGGLAKSDELPWWAQQALAWAANKASDPASAGAIGSLIATLRGMDIPVLSPMLNIALHDVPTSYMPIVQASIIENNGTLDTNLIQQRVAEFEQNQNAGVYKDREGNEMDANVAIGGFGLAARTFGANATPENRVELARLADTVMKHKLASSPAVAYAIVQQMGAQKALRDPVAFDNMMAQFGGRIQRLSPDGSQSTNIALGALEMAAKTGVPLQHAIERVISDGERKMVWERSGKTPQQMAGLQSLDQATEVTRTRGFAEAESTKGLAAWVTQTGAGRAAYADFVANPTAEKSARMFTAARQAPTWSQRGAFDPSVLKSYLGPNEMSALQMGEQMAFTREIEGKNSPLTQIMQDPAKYRAMLEDPLSMTPQQQKDFGRLSYYAKKHLANQGVRGVTVDYLANQDSSKLPLPESMLGKYEKLPAGAVKSAPPVEPTTPPQEETPQQPLVEPKVPGVRTSTP
jgi:hypothetical protein